MKMIPLTKGKVALVDDADYEWLMQWKWHAIDDGKGSCWYAARRDGLKTNFRMHRQITNAPDDAEVDHWDGDGLNNQQGVYWHKHTEKYCAQIVVSRKQIHLGLFDTAEDAAHAYDASAQKYHGRFALLNFPVESE